MAGADGVEGDEEAQLGRGTGWAMDPRRLSGAEFGNSSAFAFAFEWEPSDGTGIAVSSGVGSSEEWGGSGEGESAGDSASSSLVSSSSSPSMRGAIARGSDDNAAADVDSAEGLPPAASAFFACCLVLARRFWNQT